MFVFRYMGNCATGDARRAYSSDTMHEGRRNVAGMMIRWHAAAHSFTSHRGRTEERTEERTAEPKTINDRRARTRCMRIFFRYVTCHLTECTWEQCVAGGQAGRTIRGDGEYSSTVTATFNNITRKHSPPQSGLQRPAIARSLAWSPHVPIANSIQRPPRVHSWRRGSRISRESSYFVLLNPLIRPAEATQRARPSLLPALLP